MNAIVGVKKLYAPEVYALTKRLIAKIVFIAHFLLTTLFKKEKLQIWQRFIF